MAPGDSEQSSIAWSLCPPESRAWTANQATTLAGHWGDNVVLRKAFEDHHLDHHNPWHWRGLLFTFAAAHDGIKPDGGRPPEWTPGERVRFTDGYNAALAELRSEGRKRPSKLIIAERMKKNSPGRYPQAPSTLAKYFSMYLVGKQIRK